MFGTAIIVFREVLEAALIIGIVAAATHSIPGSRRWILAGMLAGLAGAGVVAVFTDAIGSLASGVGQELFNAIVLGIAVLMLAWHNIWMSSHGAALASSARSVGGDIRDGRSECSVLMLIVGLAILREGAETVLFLSAIANQSSGAVSFWGGFTGFSAAAVATVALFVLGKKIPLRPLFRSTGLFLLFVAAGLLAYGIHELEEVGIIPQILYPVWDINPILNEKEGFGSFLKALFGYNGNPSLTEVVFYLGYFATIPYFLKRKQNMPMASVQAGQ